jgi:pyrimidine operon attenuation protein/uracil phosphoribosyltransferase
MVVEEKKIMEGAEILGLMQKLLLDILSKNKNVSNLALIGIRTGGEFIAGWLHKELLAKLGKEISKGMIDITLYRDDIFTKKEQPTVRSTEIPFDVNKKTVILVDDVLFTGRTTRAALDALSDLGRPKSVQLAVLIDRGHRELPISADFVGKIVGTKRDEMVEVVFEGPKENWCVKVKYGVR